MKILTVVPFYSGDSAQSASMLDWMADLSGQQDRTVILAHEDQTPAQEVQRAASRAFRTVEHLIVTSERHAEGQGWPLAANCYFGCIAFAMRGRAPWLLLEHDCTFTHRDGLPMLDEELERSGKPMLGTVIPAYVRTPGGEWVEKGKMLAGVAVYHPGLWDKSPLLQSLRRTQAAYAEQNRRNPEKRVRPKAFDCYLAPDILPHAGSTPLIQHMGRSREFRRDGSQIVCSYGPESRWSPIVDPRAALVHGCKDGSLITLLRAEMGISPGRGAAAPATIVMPAAPAPRPAVSEFQWEDEKGPQKPAPVAPRAPEPQRESPPAASKPADKEAIATLGDARKAVQHWPDCKQAIYSLQTARGRYKVVCQCGANSPKLPEGPDWLEVARSTPFSFVNALPVMRDLPVELPADVAFSDIIAAANATTFDEMVAQVTPKPGPNDPRTAAECSTPPPPKIGRSKLGKPIIPRNTVGNDVPLQELRFTKDVLHKFPEWKKLTPLQRRRKLAQVKLADRREKAKEKGKAIEGRASERLLTAEARMRKLELITLCMGRRGAFIQLRRAAEKVGVTGTKRYKKDQLISAILEKEFPNPYEDFEEVKS